VNNKESEGLTPEFRVLKSRVPFLQKGVCYVTFAFDLEVFSLKPRRSLPYLILVLARLRIKSRLEDR
jgi:hypothetical protein